MTNLSERNLSRKIFVALIALLAALTAVSVFLPQGPLVPSQELPAPKPIVALVSAIGVFLLYGGLGLLGMKLSAKAGFADLWSASATVKQRLIVPAIAGVGVGVFFVLTDALLSRLSLPLPHPPFPTSLVASGVAGIGEEVIFRLFLVSALVWVFSRIVKSSRRQNQIFWSAVLVSALAFAFAHLPSLMFLYGWKTMGDIPPLLMAELVGLNGVLSLVAAHYLRKSGFLSALSIHFWADVVWHVVWGAVQR
jgi:membrane protease YdiL (CAAX protease family)